VEAELARTDDKLTDPHAEVNYEQMSKMKSGQANGEGCQLSYSQRRPNQRSMLLTLSGLAWPKFHRVGSLSHLGNLWRSNEKIGRGSGMSGRLGRRTHGDAY
jgi:hypothetical protein